MARRTARLAAVAVALLALVALATATEGKKKLHEVTHKVGDRPVLLQIWLVLSSPHRLARVG
jgi:hypothetical protein